MNQCICNLSWIMDPTPLFGYGDAMFGYVGPAGIGALGVLAILIVVLLVGAVGLLLYPIRLVMRRRSVANQPSDYSAQDMVSPPSFDESS